MGRRSENPRKRWTPEAIYELKLLARKNLPIHMIAFELQRTQGSIRTAAKRAGIIDRGPAFEEKIIEGRIRSTRLSPARPFPTSAIGIFTSGRGWAPWSGMNTRCRFESLPQDPASTYPLTCHMAFLGCALV